MINTKLWWFFSPSNSESSYELLTYDQALDLSWDGDVYIVHPSNPVYPKEFRDYNQSFIDTIDHISAQRINILIKLKAPKICIDAEKEIGMMSKYYNPFTASIYKDPSTTNNSDVSSSHSV